ncbi:MAG: methyltransferase domain-containing protein [bacterium]
MIVPTRDRAGLIGGLPMRLARVRHEHVAAELIVIDDGSREPVTPSLTGARAFGREVVVLRQGRFGPARARNQGARRARGRVLVFFADDLDPDPDWLVAHLRAHADVAASSSQPTAFVGRVEPPADGGDTPFDRFVWRTGVHFDFAAAERESRAPGGVSFTRFHTSNLSIARAAFLAVGGFDEGFEIAAWEDVELGYRLTHRGVAVGWAGDASVRALPRSGRSLGEYLRWRERALPSAYRALRQAPVLATLVARRRRPRWRGFAHRLLWRAIAVCDVLDRRGVPLPSELYRRLLGHFQPFVPAPPGAETPIAAGRIVRDPITGRARFDARGSDSLIAGELLLEALVPFRRRLAGAVLDLGCGDGPLRAPLELPRDGYVGIDRSPRASAASVRADAARLPICDARFDGVVVAEVLEHVRAPDLVLAEVFRVARPGASVLVSAPFFYRIHDAPEDRWRFTEDGLALLLRGAGFEIEQIRAVGGAGAVIADFLARNLATLPGECVARCARALHLRWLERLGGALTHRGSVAAQRAFLWTRAIALRLATRHGETGRLTRFLWDRGSRMAKGYVVLARKPGSR